MDKGAKIYIAGHRGMVGSAIWRNLESKGYTNIIGKTFDELDLTQQQSVADFFEKEKPEYVFLAAAKVGGIVANNTYRAQFIYENIQIQNNIIHQAYLNGVKKLLFLGSSCIYPKNAPQPLKEDYLLTSELEYTNEPYAIAKIAGIKMCESYNLQYGTNFISVMPTNLYGLNDNYDLEKSHVLPAFIRKMYLAKCIQENNIEALHKDIEKRPIKGLPQKCTQDEALEVLKNYGLLQKDDEIMSIQLWGSGKPQREFLHANDMADACVYIMQKVDFKDIRLDGKEIRNTHINIGCGEDLSIKDLAKTVKEVLDFKGELHWDTTKPDGTLRKLLDVSKLNDLGWKQTIQLKQGIKTVFEEYQK